MRNESIAKAAAISADRQYRYELTREWGDETSGLLTWILLNPSTADASHDDPTIRKCIKFSIANGYAGMRVLNLFALRATNPDELQKHEDPIGPENDSWLASVPESRPVVAAWGGHDFARARARNVAQFLLPNHQIFCLGETKDGAPRHPLYVRSSQVLEVWNRI